jgi:type IV secretion system protein VirB2
MNLSRTPLRTARALLASLAVLALLALPGVALAQSGLEGTDNDVRDFFRNINSLLNIASVAVVTIAVIFAGYQIAFAHKRISDVAPILIGGFMIGAAAQIANMLIGEGDDTNPVAVIAQLLPMYA